MMPTNKKIPNVIVNIVDNGRPMNDIQRFVALKAQELREQYDKKYRS